MPTITTVLPTYNRSKLLIRAINSVLSQSHRDTKIVVRDNCSTDDTEEVVASFAAQDARVCYLKNSENIGISENIRLGIRNVKTEYFSFLCDDDYLEPEFYSTALMIFNQYPDASFIAFRVDSVDLEGKILSSNMKHCNSFQKETYYKSEEGFDAYLEGLLPYTMTGYIFRKNVADTIDFGSFGEIGYGADIHFIWRAASRFNFVVTNIKGGNFTVHEKSISSMLVKVFDERFLYWWRNRMLIIRNDPKVSSVIKSKISKYYLSHSTKSVSSFKHYAHAAILLMIDRVRNEEFDELKIDFIAMRSFLSWPILFGIKLVVVVLVHMKLDNKLRSLVRHVRKTNTITTIK